jgi:hypothetical protein
MKKEKLTMTNKFKNKKMKTFKNLIRMKKMKMYKKKKIYKLQVLMKSTNID